MYTETETLRTELNLLSESARHGDHEKVSEVVGISRAYLWQLRTRKELAKDSPAKIEIIKQSIKAYRSIQMNRQRQLEAKLKTYDTF